MRRIRASRSVQRGAALILAVAILILGVAWFTVGALGKVATGSAEREVRTGLALRTAKTALLAHVAQYAARSDTANPGQLACPESVNLTNVGVASGSCAGATLTGRLPWKTLGIDQLRDGDGEPLWYVISPGFRNPPINFGSVGQLAYNGAANAAVALIIAPGQPLPIGGCNTLNQQVSTRNAAPLNPGNFLECGNTTGNYANPGTSQWNNDRVIAITAAEWADAIAPAIADRLQRQVAPALAGWDHAELAARGQSWGVTHDRPYLPLASTFSDPATNSYCGAADVREGLTPISTQALGCTNKWTAGVPLISGLTFIGCAPVGTYLNCFFSLNPGGTPPFSARISATAPRVAGSFRGTITVTDVTVVGVAPDTKTLAMSVSSATGGAAAVVDLSWPPSLPVGSLLQVHIPHVVDAAVLADTRLTWFLSNNWNRYTYYAVAPGATAGATPPCAGATCLTANGLSDTGSPSDKRFVLALMGPALATQTQPSSDPAQYLESHTVGTTVFNALTATNTFNDRLAACPFNYTPAGGPPVAICN